MTINTFTGSGAQEQPGFAWLQPVHQVKWEIAGSPGQLSGLTVATNTRTFEYPCVMGSQLLVFFYYSPGSAPVTALSLMPEFRLDRSQIIGGEEVASFLAGDTYAAPCSYRPGADALLGAASGTPVTPLVLRYDRIDIPLDVVNTNTAGLVNVVFPYVTMGNLVRFRLLVTGGPDANAGGIQMYLARGAIASSSLL